MAQMERAKRYLNTEPRHEWRSLDGGIFCSACGARSPWRALEDPWCQTPCRGGGPPRSIDDVCVHMPHGEIVECDMCMTAFYSGEWIHTLPGPALTSPTRKTTE